MYLNNAANVNSRLARTLDDLLDFNYEIRYIPGKDNCAADYLSRMQLVDNAFLEVTPCDELPEGLEVICKVDGGGNSIFESLLACMKQHQKYKDPSISVPETADVLREELIDKLIEAPTRYGLDKTKHSMRALKCMRRPGQMVMIEVLLAFSEVYQVSVLVHCGQAEPVIFCDKKGGKITNRIHLQCLANVHYNPVQETLVYDASQLDTGIAHTGVTQLEELTNHDTDKVEVDIVTNQLTFPDDNIGLSDTVIDPNAFQAFAMYSFTAEGDDELELVAGDVVVVSDCSNPSWWKGSSHTGCGLFPSNFVMPSDIGKVDRTQINNFSCDHVHNSAAVTTVYCLGKFCCGILDSGAQISLVSSSVIDRVRGSSPLPIDDINLNLTGFGKDKTDSVGSVSLSIAVPGLQKPVEHVFCVVEAEVMQYCFLLGNNFLKQTGLILNFDNLTYGLNNSVHRFGLGSLEADKSSTINSINVVANVTLCSNAENSNHKNSNVVNLRTIELIQKRDYAIRQLRKKVLVKELPKNWQHGCLKQFKPYFNQLRLGLDILYFDKGQQSVPVVSFRFLTNSVESFHCDNAHIGMQKLMNLVGGYMWHPALQSVVHDVCRSCTHCQLAKVSNQCPAPPVRKINAQGVFDMLVVDLIEFPRSKSGYVCCLVAIDHYSKWLSVIPLRNKKGTTVAAACEQILSTLTKCPNKIHSDNGPEFRSHEFKTLLSNYNVKQSHSVPYHPPSCGEVERVNRTITALLKSLTTSMDEWDKYLSRAVLIYNTTKHSALHKSPSEFILTQSHNVGDITASLIPNSIEYNWNEGNPRFIPFRVGQKVVRKIPFQERLNTTKLGLVYEGPFVIKTVYPNEVSYVIQELENSTRTLRVHHTQIKIWHDTPSYLRKIRQSSNLAPINKNRYLHTSVNNEQFPSEHGERGADTISPLYISDTSERSESDSEFSGFEDSAPVNHSTSLEKLTASVNQQCESEDRGTCESKSQLDNARRCILDLLDDHDTLISAVERSLDAQNRLVELLSETSTLADQCNEPQISIEPPSPFIDISTETGQAAIGDNETSTGVLLITVTPNTNIEIEASGVSQISEEGGSSEVEAVIPVVTSSNLNTDSNTINTFVGFSPECIFSNPLRGTPDSSNSRRASLSPIKAIIAAARRDAENMRKLSRDRKRNLHRYSRTLSF